MPAPRHRLAIRKALEGAVISALSVRLKVKNLKSFVYKNVDNTSVLMTDEFKSHKTLRKDFQHKIVRHSFGEYVRGKVHTNTVKGYFSLLKRGITGVFHHISQKHLHRYLQEFDFRYNMRKVEDTIMASMLIHNIEGKRLFYWDSYKKRA